MYVYIDGNTRFDYSYCIGYNGFYDLCLVSSSEASTCNAHTSNTQAEATSIPNTPGGVAGAGVRAGDGDGATLRCAGSSSSERGAVETWSGRDVQAFVRGLKEDFGDRAEEYAEAMAREDVDGRVLLQLQQVFSFVARTGCAWMW